MTNDQKYLSTGISKLDTLLDNKGYKCGKIIELFGEEHVGKTYVSLVIAEKAIEEGKAVLYADADGSLSSNFIDNMGLSLKGMNIFYPKSLTDFFKFMVNKIKIYDLFILDSFPALFNCSANDTVAFNKYAVVNQVAHDLRLISRQLFLTNKTFIIINQLRFIRKGFIINITPGKKILSLYSALRIQMSKGEFIRYRDKIIGHEVIFKICKNSDGTPNKTDCAKLYYNIGFVNENS